MTSFKDFAERTKNDCIVILSGMILIGFSAFGKALLGTFMSMIIKLIGMMILSYAIFVYVLHLKTYFTEHPDFFFHSQYAPYRQNILACCGVCILITGLLVYAMYTIFV